MSQLSADERSRLAAPHHAPQEDRSRLAALLQPFWSAVAERLPPWVAPNLLTVAGALCVAVPTAALLASAPAGRGPIPTWVLLLNVAGVFCFQTLDAIDGKQARRTGTSSALGSWLDHALDIATMQLAILGACVSLQVGAGLMLWFVLGSVVVNNYLLHWEAHHAGKLVLGDGTSITEAQALLMLLHGLTAAFGTEMWARSLEAWLPFTRGLPGASAGLGAWVLGVSVVGVGFSGAFASVLRVRAALVARGEPWLPKLTEAWGSVALVGAAGFAVGLAESDGARLFAIAACSALGVRHISAVVLGNLVGRAPVAFQAAHVGVWLAPLAFVSAQAMERPEAGELVAAGVFAVAALTLLGHLARTALGLSRALGVPLFTVRASGQKAGG